VDRRYPPARQALAVTLAVRMRELASVQQAACTEAGFAAVPSAAAQLFVIAAVDSALACNQLF